MILRGENVRLRPLTEENWDVLLEWNKDPEVLYYSEEEDISSRTLEEVKRIYCSVSRNAYCFIVEYKGRPVGECCLQKMNLDRIIKKYLGKDCRRIDLMIGEKQLWGQGMGTEIIGVLTRFGFMEEKADFIFGCDIGDHNPRSMKSFEKNGYRISSKNKCTHGGKAKYNYNLVISRDDYLSS